MHDPDTLAFEIKSPIYKTINDGTPKAWRYRNPLVSVWHHDPESGGSDDSCGFSVPHLPTKMRERLKNAAWSEGRDPYFLRCRSKTWTGTRREAEAIYRGLLLFTARAAGIPLTVAEATEQAARDIHRPDCCDLAGRLCYLPGYHTNFEEDTKERRETHFYGLMCGIARWMLMERRPWYRHPRFHVWHWRVSVPLLCTFKRWAFSRCCKCGGRFAWGHAPTSNSWHGTGPRWFRGERDVYHSGSCDGSSSGVEKTSA